MRSEGAHEKFVFLTAMLRSFLLKKEIFLGRLGFDPKEITREYLLLSYVYRYCRLSDKRQRPTAS